MYVAVHCRSIILKPRSFVDASTENIPFVLEESNTGSKNRLAPPQDKSQASSDAETGKKRSKSKSKSSKEPKAGSELSTQPDDKKQRHKSRRTVESTPKKSKSKGHKEAGSENMTTLPYLAVCKTREQICRVPITLCRASHPFVVLLS